LNVEKKEDGKIWKKKKKKKWAPPGFKPATYGLKRTQNSTAPQ
jgi:hypothetical protein